MISSLFSLALDFLSAFLIWKIIGFVAALIWAYALHRKGQSLEMTEEQALEVAKRYESPSP